VKRWALRICLFPLLGAIVNVAVAWGCALQVPMDATWVHLQHRAQATWQPLDEIESGRKGFLLVAQFRRFGSTRVDVFAGNFHHGPADDVPRGSPINDCPAWCRRHVLTAIATSNSSMMAIEGRGFPLLAIWCEPAEEEVLGRRVNPPVGGIEVDERLAATSDRFTRPTLPFFIILPGFAINTLFYTGILWLLFAAPFALRRRRRIKRGLCPACAYPVGDSSVCTECGAAVMANRSGDRSRPH
jgi:hypothetical protein